MVAKIILKETNYKLVSVFKIENKKKNILNQGLLPLRPLQIPRFTKWP